MSRYELKPGPYSSHSLLVGSLPAAGEGRSVLDLGCGNGYLAEILAGRGYSVTGVERCGGVTRPFPAGVRFVEGDLDAGLPVLPGPFQYILCADILEHLKDPAALLAALPPLLLPGGRVVASLPNSGHAYFRWHVLMGRFPAHERGLFDRTHLHFYTWDGWVELFSGAGFRFETVRPSGVPVGLAFPGLAETAPIRAAESLSYYLARAWKRLFGYQFVVTARPEARKE